MPTPHLLTPFCTPTLTHYTIQECCLLAQPPSPPTYLPLFLDEESRLVVHYYCHIWFCHSVYVTLPPLAIEDAWGDPCRRRSRWMRNLGDWTLLSSSIHHNLVCGARHQHGNSSCPGKGAEHNSIKKIPLRHVCTTIPSSATVSCTR